MMDISFFTGLWIAFFVVALGSFFVFFAKQFKTFVLGCALSLSGINIQILNFDIFRESKTGQVIIVALWILFLFEMIAFKYALSTESKINKMFFGLPLLAFVSTAVSLDLLTLAFGLSLFAITFAVFGALKGQKKEKLFIAIQKMGIAFLGYAYGMAILFTREATTSFGLLRKELCFKAGRENGLDEWTILGVGLVVLAVVIELYAVIPLIGKKNEKV
ncbi:MAG: hypothetical protein J6P93_05575 [Alphaproteobacteria bacterium]|nr:hypothetical protein [Alphaproteobacteria bacterium]